MLQGSFAVFVLGCSTISNVASDTNLDVFMNTEKHMGEQVVVRGFMRYRFENRNFFPSEQQVNRKLCLPILIKNMDVNMIEKAEARDGTIVEISGKLVRAAGPGMVSVSTCKQVGIEVESIR